MWIWQELTQIPSSAMARGLTGDACSARPRSQSASDTAKRRAQCWGYSAALVNFYIFSHCWCQGWGWGWLQPRNKGPGVRKAVCAGGEGGRHHAEETNSWMHTQVSKTETLDFWLIGMPIMLDSWGTKSRQWGFIINTSSPCTNYNIIKWQWIMHGDILMLFVSENHGLGSNILAAWMNLNLENGLGKRWFLVNVLKSRPRVVACTSAQCGYNAARANPPTRNFANLPPKNQDNHCPGQRGTATTPTSQSFVPVSKR